ncbi:16800_t:CDS:2 [Dentiscutata heterogama]|uniref:16800_t:CDS:1 n=1 Tax=Dentiscutata heterogama TaxID=1316150 RepID=A0ACA9MPG6_9GLOM|nr:16800_t:CDS:2 [Dentiscutata heterogama]
MNSETFLDYYEILGISETATNEEIRDAYKKKALETHPDRFVPGTSDSAISPTISQEEAKDRFQKIADAYYVLSDESRRAQYVIDSFLDRVRTFRKKKGEPTTTLDVGHANANQIFGDVFEELLRPEVDNPQWFYAPIGAVTGGALGFICANVPGLVLGAYAGNKLGAIRDAKGVSVYDAYSKLSSNHKAAILSSLAAKLITSGRI